MENIMTPEQITKLYKDGKISIYERDELKKLWKNLSDEQKKQLLNNPNQYQQKTESKSEGKSKGKSKTSDTEIQLKILENLRSINSSSIIIKGWLTFFGILQVIGIISLIALLN
jgi:hypothetical protein